MNKRSFRDHDLATPFGYFPASLAGGLASFGAVYALTRLLSPADYGFYALVPLLAGVERMRRWRSRVRMLPSSGGIAELILKAIVGATI